jgi:hypothetical protein
MQSAIRFKLISSQNGQPISALQAGTAVCIPAGLNTYLEIVEFVRACGTTLAYHIPLSPVEFG